MLDEHLPSAREAVACITIISVDAENDAWLSQDLMWTGTHQNAQPADLLLDVFDMSRFAPAQHPDPVIDKSRLWQCVTLAHKSAPV